MKRTMNKWIDISVPIYNGMPCWPSDPSVEIVPYKIIGKETHSNVALLKMGSHTGTHIDAPRHFLSKGITVDHLSFEAMIGKVKVIEIKDPVAVYAKELQSQGIRPRQRIILKTRNSSTAWWKKKFNKTFVYVSLDAAEFLASRRVQFIGIDYISVGGYKHEDGIKVHQTLLKKNICIAEGLALAGIKSGYYDMVCLPIKIEQGDGAPTRILLRKQ